MNYFNYGAFDRSELNFDTMHCLCATFQLDSITGSGSFFTFVFPQPTNDRDHDRGDEMTTDKIFKLI